MLISIVIPVHNEADNIGRLIREISMLSLNHPYQIVCVDDASNDNTPVILSEIQKNMTNMKAIRHKEKYGQSGAIVTGVEHSEGELIATMDGDGQNDPSDIPKLISILLNNKTCRMVTGYRKKRTDSLWRVISSKIANSVRSFLLKDENPDTGCGLKVFYKSAFTALPLFDHIHRFLPALIKMQGGDVISVEVNHRERKFGISNYGTLDRLWAGLIDLTGVSWLRLRIKKISVREIIHE
ncbi:MAG: glycosyltransferase family 2 protein [Desulfosarcina sp.]|nr:glycosyltransferase family 2 protein [Desulfobacterales bacterium]